jgi:hypothetical protein
MIDESYLQMIERRTLGWCNQMREEREVGPPLQALPVGIPRDPETCPCGKATGLHVDLYDAYASRDHFVEDKPPLEKLPDDVAEFVRRFDNFQFPHLIDPNWDEETG